MPFLRRFARSSCCRHPPTTLNNTGRHWLHNQRPIVIVRTHRRTWSEQRPTNNIVDLLRLFMGKITVVRSEIEIAYGVDNDHGPRLIWASFWPLLPRRRWRANSMHIHHDSSPNRHFSGRVLLPSCSLSMSSQARHGLLNLRMWDRNVPLAAEDALHSMRLCPF